MRRIYLDNSATAPPFPKAVAAAAEVSAGPFGNPSSLHRMGMEAEAVLEEARRVVADGLRADPSEVIFTSGGTESNNLALFGVAANRRHPHVVVSAVEHSSVLEAARRLAERGVAVDVAPVDADGQVRLDALRELVRPNTSIVSVMRVNNEVGTVQPIREIARILDDVAARYGRRPVLHTDAVQAFCRVDVDPKAQGVDLVTVSAHKIGGPKGIGALYVRRGIRLVPLLVGGDQEGGLRAGTQNVPGAAGFGAALRIWQQSGPTMLDHLQRLRDVLREALNTIPGLAWNTPAQAERTAPHILNFSVPGLRGETLVHRLAAEGVYVSTGSACHSRKPRPSHVLLAMGRSEQEAMSSIRVSLGPQNTEAEVLAAARAIRAAVEDLSAVRL
ncbi:MAG: cysteine desulfurase family protein [Armatimonadota bacterium]|nr:cysteine desulfurase family protein [Armatimonadota bacterium]